MAHDFMAGCIGGCAGIIVGHPLDTIKVNLQTQDAKNPKYKGILDSSRTIFVKNGLRGMYKGMSSPLVGVAGINAIVFGIHANLQRNLPDTRSLGWYFLTGSVAGLCQSVICSPMELVKIRVQQATSRFATSLDCLKHIYRSQGVKGVYQGMAITTAREVPAFGSYFLAYEIFSRSPDGSPPTTMRMFMAGGAAGVISWLVVHPVDVIKSRIQIDGMNGPRKYRSSWHCFMHSINYEGYRILLKGLAPSLLRAFPTNGACFTAVTWSMKLLSGEVNFEVANLTCVEPSAV